MEGEVPAGSLLIVTPDVVSEKNREDESKCWMMTAQKETDEESIWWV